MTFKMHERSKNTQNIVLLTKSIDTLAWQWTQRQNTDFGLFENALHKFGTSVQSLLWMYISCYTLANSTNCCSLPTHNVVEDMISYIESMQTLNMIVVQHIENWDLDLSPFQHPIQILASCRKLSKIDSQWLNLQQMHLSGVLIHML